MQALIEFFLSSFNSGDPVSDRFIWLIFGVAVLAFILEIGSIVKYWFRDCKETQKGIKYLNENKSEIDVGLVTKKEIKKWLQRHFVIQNGQLIKDENDRKKFSILSAPSILSQPVPRGPVYFAPTLLTALGILGTFAGIYLGLKNINLNNISEADNLLKASTELMEGMKLAFVTSLFGLGTSSVFMVILAVGKWLREKRRDDLRNQLREIAILETPVKILSRLGNQQSSQKELVESLKDVADSLKGISNLSADEIGKATGRCFRTVVQQDIKPLYQELYQELQQLRTTQESQGQTVETLIQQMETQLIEPVVKRLDESAALTKEASSAVRELRESLGGMTESLSSAISTIQEFQKTTLGELQDFAVNLQGILGQFRTDTEGVMQKVSLEIERAVNTSIEGMEAQRQAFELSAEKAADTFKGIRLDFEEELKNFRDEYQESLNNFFTEQNQLLQETLGEQRDGLAQVVDSLKTVFIEDSQHMSEEIKTSMNTIKETVEKVSKLSNTLGLTSGERLAQLQELARTIGDEANQVSRHYQNMTTQFNAALQAGNQQLAGYLQQANEVYSNRIQEFDTATATICKQLNSTSHEFMGVAQYLVSAANDLRNTNGKN